MKLKYFCKWSIYGTLHNWDLYEEQDIFLKNFNIGNSCFKKLPTFSDIRVRFKDHVEDIYQWILGELNVRSQLYVSASKSVNACNIFTYACFMLLLVCLSSIACFFYPLYTRRQTRQAWRRIQFSSFAN